MKYRIFTLILAMVLVGFLFCSCAAEAPTDESVQAQQEAPVTKIQRVTDSERKLNEESLKIFTIDPNASIENIPDESVPLAAAPVEGPLTKRDAESIAVQHAGFEINQVSFLFTKLVEDVNIAYFEVNFRFGTYEYEINVHPKTGEILAFTKADING